MKNATYICSLNNSQLPFFLHAVPTASLPFPPFGMQRRNLQLQIDRYVRKSVLNIRVNNLLGAKADTGWVGEDGVDVLALWALDIHEE